MQFWTTRLLIQFCTTRLFVIKRQTVWSIDQLTNSQKFLFEKCLKSVPTYSDKQAFPVKKNHAPLIWSNSLGKWWRSRRKKTTISFTIWAKKGNWLSGKLNWCHRQPIEIRQVSEVWTYLIKISQESFPKKCWITVGSGEPFQKEGFILCCKNKINLFAWQITANQPKHSMFQSSLHG